MVASPRANARSHPVPPIDWPGKEEEWIRLIVNVVRGIMDGKINAIGTVTLTASSATTTLTDIRVGPDTVILFMPTTANAAGALSGLYVSARTEGSATLTHANNAQSDKTFDYALLG